MDFAAFAVVVQICENYTIWYATCQQRIHFYNSNSLQVILFNNMINTENISL